ncbi:ribonuclease catalytic domain-containing protein [Taylorella asinigenitalis]|uniref:Exoribonuclease II n=1 Tax=Taylorella asinigenitalis (strain MCE3) TaxID=1008459 RepID=G4QA54_TAYAM|nr:RNB domain-containing ribonuclease [Taylorella asinigenitalis]AEP37127.1 Exoribonuclease II [Taylorella asinigenitalis MCE3]
MHLVYEEAGKLKVGSISKDAPATYQVTTTSGKVVKVKKQNVLFEFDDIDPKSLQESELPKIDMPAHELWELIPQEGIDFENLVELCADEGNNNTKFKYSLLEFIRNNPIYFQKKTKTFFVPAPKEQIESALLANEKKRKQEELLNSYVDGLYKKALPQEINKDPQIFLNKNKSPLFYKALEIYLKETNKNLNSLMMELGLFDSELDLHNYLILDKYPDLKRSHTFGLDVKIPDTKTLSSYKLEKATVSAYSVDDENTTEIDDAFSIEHIDGDIYALSIHIAAPGLVYDKGNWLHKIAANRMSTFYSPTDKFTMLPDEVVNSFSLVEGIEKPAVSLYLKVNIETGEVLEHTNKVELLEVKENLSLNKFDDIITEEFLNSDSNGEFSKYRDIFKPLLSFAKARSKIREAYRGYPETQRNEYFFNISEDSSKVSIIPRNRTSPLNFIVAELMILCNYTWAEDLSKARIPAIFRGYSYGRTTHGLSPAPHALIGVDKYAWLTSPLRRFVDLVNQAQLIAYINGGMAAKLISPFKPKDDELHKLIAAFDDTYSNYNIFQTNLEKYWCLRYIIQENITEVKATAIRDNIVRFDDLPFVCELEKSYAFERGEPLNFKINSVDLAALTLDLNLL